MNEVPVVDGVVLVHGGTCAADIWDEVLPMLSFPAVAVDLPGRGSTPADNAGLLAENPHFIHNTPDKRGYTVLNLSRQQLTADLKALDDVTQADSPIQSAAKFTVVPGRMELERG